MTAQSTKPVDPDRWRNLVVFLTIVTTVIVAIVAGLQAEAGIRNGAANRDSQFYAIKIAGELQRKGLEGNYDMAMYGRTLQDRLESTVLELTALQFESQGDSAGAQAASIKAESAKARADVEQAACVLYTDPRFAPKSVDDPPNMEVYVKTLNATATDLLAKENKAADEYTKWSEKSDSFTAVLTLLAVALFLFGLAQAVSPRMRLLFAGYGVVGTVAAVVWVLAIILS